ncbi:hypothetical protein KIPB_005081 [Kipferlia bialata]|uniref:Uncharacterized protein n=1 Tax=Kipferlia bialata TaxID=797122 RepID=A0A9K3CW42_9EUKA|nr:hypothetical protein KIPB_005081 [Kipferlia bialata]|eukprot:g5081.t1
MHPSFNMQHTPGPRPQSTRGSIARSNRTSLKDVATPTTHHVLTMDKDVMPKECASRELILGANYAASDKEFDKLLSMERRTASARKARAEKARREREERERQTEREGDEERPQ